MSSWLAPSADASRCNRGAKNRGWRASGQLASPSALPKERGCESRGCCAGIGTVCRGPMDGAAEVRRVPGSLIKSPPAIDPGGTFRSDPVPDLPESLQRPRAHTRRASANANARVTAGEARTRAPPTICAAPWEQFLPHPRFAPGRARQKAGSGGQSISKTPVARASFRSLTWLGLPCGRVSLLGQ